MFVSAQYCEVKSNATRPNAIAQPGNEGVRCSERLRAREGSAGTGGTEGERPRLPVRLEAHPTNGKGPLAEPLPLVSL